MCVCLCVCHTLPERNKWQLSDVTLRGDGVAHISTQTGKIAPIDLHVRRGVTIGQYARALLNKNVTCDRHWCQRWYRWITPHRFHRDPAKAVVSEANAQPIRDYTSNILYPVITLALTLSTHAASNNVINL